MLVTKYGGSIPAMLAEIYPEYDWLPWKFSKCANTYWDDINNQRKFVEWVGKELKIKEMSDWYNVSWKVEKYFST